MSSKSDIGSVRKNVLPKKNSFSVFTIDISRILPIHSNTPIHLISDMKFDVFYVVSVITNVVSGTHKYMHIES